MKEKKAVTREYLPRYQHASKKEKMALLDEFTTLTGCHRKYAIRLLGAKQVKQVLLSIGHKPVKIKPEKKRPSNRKGKRIYSDEVITALRLVWTFFWFKCGKILAPLMRQQMSSIASWPAFGITALPHQKCYRKGKCISIYVVISTLRLIWTFFWFKREKILRPLIRAVNVLHRRVASLQYHRVNHGKTQKDKPL
jgi:hypothetical protein